MENASKALIIAGGVLLAMMILSLLVYVGTSMTDMAESQDRITLAKQKKEFNDGYLAYNKTRLYGTDVITVINKAINHNKTVGAKEIDPYYINVQIQIKQPFEVTIMRVDYTNAYPEPEDITETSDAKRVFGNITYNKFLKEPGTYSLGNWQNNEEEFVMNNNFVLLFTGDTTDKTINEGNITYIRKSALTNFKTAVFECESMEDTEKDGNKDGRIDTIVFKQIKI